MWNLFDEFQFVTEALTDDIAGELLDLRVDAVPVHVGPGIARFRPHGIYWEYDDTGPIGIIIGEWHAGIVCDLILFQLQHPCRWWFRTGQADLLGDYNIQQALKNGEPVKLHRSPLEWLHDDCQGAVPLNWDQCWMRIGNLPRILTANRVFRETVCSELERRRPPLPEIRWAA